MGNIDGSNDDSNVLDDNQNKICSNDNCRDLLFTDDWQPQNSQNVKTCIVTNTNNLGNPTNSCYLKYGGAGGLVKLARVLRIIKIKMIQIISSLHIGLR